MGNFKDMKVLIMGLGLNGGGVGSAKFFAQHEAQVRVTDLKQEIDLKLSINELKEFRNIEYSLGGHKNEDFSWADLIIKNPGVKPNNPYLNLSNKLGKKVEQDMGIFLQFVKPSQLIGITGTKGKSTTASLIYEVLKSSGKKVILAGNIGKSVLDCIDLVKEDSLVILELSSFQLEAFGSHKISPHWAVITNIYPDHLNYYKNMDEYIAAKKIIGLYQAESDFLFINSENEEINKHTFLEGLHGKKIFYSTSDLPARNASHSDAGGPKDFQPTLKGNHNLSNIAGAHAVGNLFNINSDQMLKSLTDFSGVPFRMELIKTWNGPTRNASQSVAGGVKIINDTTATNPDAAIQSIKTFPNSILICGGMNKRMNYKELAEVIKQYVKEVFFIEGDATNAILRSLQAKRDYLKIHGPYNNLESLLTDVKKVSESGDTILFSPGATSFNLFQNEFDRGRKFNEAVQKVFLDD
mgnify:CR=1 FL=1